MNLLQNRLMITGTGGDQVLASLAEGKRKIDFNRIQPTPKDFRGEWSALGCAGYYLEYSENISDVLGNSELIAYTNSLNAMQKETARRLAADYRWNRKMLSVHSVYHWKALHWGTPYNAFKTPDPRDTKNVIYFQTITSVQELMHAIALRHRNVDVSHDWADTTGKGGGIRYRGGNKIGALRVPNHSKEFYLLFVDLWGDDFKQFFFKSGDRYVRMV